jgi:hypothetical protein
MSTSAREAAQQLKEDLANLLPDRYRSSLLNGRLAEDLKSYRFTEIPGNFDDACIFFREFFKEISHPNIVSYGSSNRPIVFQNILLAIKNFGSRLRVFRRVITKTAKEHCHYEALFAVICEALHKPVDYYQRFNSQNGRDFLLKGMIMVRIEQRRHFPPGPSSELTYLFHFSLDEIISWMKRKNGMSDHEETRSHMKVSLKLYNICHNVKYSTPIRLLLKEKPNFFLDFKSDLEILSQFIIRNATKESFWLRFMNSMTFKLYEALDKAGIVRENKKWIVYWYIRHHHSQPTLARESFNDLMTRIVQPGQMAFPFRQPPRLFKSNGFIFRAALNWELIPTDDLKEICYRSHINSQYGQVPSQCVLAASVRRKLYEVEITKATVKIQKMARRSLWQFYLKRLIAALIIKQRVLRIVTPILHVKHTKFLIISAVQRVFIQEKFFKRLEHRRYIQQIEAGCVIFKVLNKQNHFREYQKIRAGSIIQSRLIALFERQRIDKRIGPLRAALTLSRFTKVKHAKIVRTELQRNYATNIIQSRLIALFERQQANARIELLKAASTLSRFAKVKLSTNVRTELQKFVKDLSCYSCPICLDCLDSVSIEMIQPCGHIHCKTCFDNIKKCSNCRAEIILKDCKSVGTFLSQSKPRFFFTLENDDKKIAVAVIIKWWAMKRRPVSRI